MRARIIRKKRSVGLIPKADEKITREALDEAVLRIQSELDNSKINLPFCAFNGGRDAWVDVGNKRVGVQVLQSYLGVPPEESLHIGDQFLNTGNDFAARSVCPCVWITSPEETSYILKSILRLAGVPLMAILNPVDYEDKKQVNGDKDKKGIEKKVDFDEMERRTSRLAMDVFTGEMDTKGVGLVLQALDRGQGTVVEQCEREILLAIRGLGGSRGAYKRERKVALNRM